MNENFLAARYCRFYKTAPVQKGVKLAFQAFEGLCRAGPEAGRRLDEFALPGQFPQAGQEIFLLLRGAWTSLIIASRLSGWGAELTICASFSGQSARQVSGFCRFSCFSQWTLYGLIKKGAK